MFYLQSWILIISIVIIFLIIYYIQLNGNFIKNIRDNWKKYQCKPYILPIAGLFKPENSDKNFFTFTFENFKKCQWRQVKMFFGYFIKPIQYIINIITNILKNFTNTLDIFRIEAKNIRGMFKEIVIKIADKMENSYAAIQFYQAKMKNIMKHQIALFQLLMYFIESLKLTMDSLINGPLIDLVKFLPVYGIALLVLIIICMLCIFGGLFTKMIACPICLICFSGDTLCNLENGIKNIKDINLGDNIYKGVIVTSTFIFYIKNKKSDIYNYNGIKVSGSHIVFDTNGNITRIKDNPRSIKINFKEDYLYCLNTKNKLISINSNNKNYLFSDFFECPDNKLNHYHQQLIQNKLNNTNNINFIKPYHNYEWGMGSNTLVVLSNGTTKKIKDINIGDVLLKGGTVYGLVKHLGSESKMYSYNGIILAGTVLLLLNNKWTRVYEIPNLKIIKTNIIYHLVCDNHIIYLNKNIIIRDYLELEETDELFDELLENNLNYIKNNNL